MPGFKNKRIKAYILLTRGGEFLGFDPGDDDEILCPDFGSATNGGAVRHFLVDNAKFILNLPESKDNADKIKLNHEHIKEMFKLAKENEPLLQICEDALDNGEILQKICDAFNDSKYKLTDNISFKIENTKIIELDTWHSWWQQYRKEKTSSKDETKDSNYSRCFITGELVHAIERTPKVSGLNSVGGHSAGDALIAFDKRAFQSYGLKAAFNATVSENAIVSVNASLNNLIGMAPILAGSKFIHWYQQPIPTDCDILNLLDDRKLERIDTEDEEKDYFDSDAPIEDYTENYKNIMEQANRLIQSIKKGENPIKLDNRYYILHLSGANGRIMVRNYMQGSYEELYHNFKEWYEDLRLVTIDGKGESKIPKLFALYIRLIKAEKSSKDLLKRISKELSGLESSIKFSIICNTRLPDTVAARAIAYIRSKMFLSNEDGSRINDHPDMLACQWLKVWLIRKSKEKGEVITVGERLNTESPSIAYHTGRLMAVYAEIQKAALGRDIGAGVIQRYYTAASTSPALVVGKLAQLSQHHLSKIENKGKVIYFEKMLSEITCKIGTQLPKTLTLEQQSQFALGYYQQIADIFSKSNKEEQN